MVSSTIITVVQSCAASPPPQSTTPTTLPLTYFDIPWLLFSPTQPLFFYDFSTTTTHFTQNILPNLKHSLSLTLQHFFPLAGNLVTPPNHAEPFLEYTENDSISLNIAEAAAGDFKNFSGNHPKIARNSHVLIPALKSGSFKKQLLAIQITVFPECGICVGFNLRNVVADGRTFDNFLKTWASISRNGEMRCAGHVALNDRSVIRDPSGHKSVLLEQWWQIKSSQKDSLNGIINNSISYDIMRATFWLGPPEMEHLKKWILDGSKKLFGSAQLLLSPYVLACAFLWTCWMKTHWPTMEECEGSVHYFGFIAGGITRLQYPLPVNYVGNCVSFGRSKSRRNNLIGENGIVHAAKAIGEKIKMLNEDVAGGAKNWLREWKEVRESELHLVITGSPKLGTYGLDYGWGRPVKVEEVSVDITRAISLCESSEVVGGMEIGLALPKTKMEVFSNLFNKGLS